MKSYMLLLAETISESAHWGLKGMDLVTKNTQVSYGV